MNKKVLFTLFIAAVISSPALGQAARLQGTQTQSAQKPLAKPTKDSARAANLSNAASINEDLIGLALEGKADKVSEKIIALRAAMPALRPLLDAKAYETVSIQLGEMEQASAKDGALAAALVSVEFYRVLEMAMDPVSRRAPLEVAMIDYVGFKLSVLTKMAAPDWQLISAAARESDTSWATLAPGLRDASLRNLVSAIQEGLAGAVQLQDLNGVKFAAKLQLEVVDVLEGYFNRSGPPGKAAAN